MSKFYMIGQIIFAGGMTLTEVKEILKDKFDWYVKEYDQKPTATWGNGVYIVENGKLKLIADRFDTSG